MASRKIGANHGSLMLWILLVVVVLVTLHHMSCDTNIQRFVVQAGREEAFYNEPSQQAHYDEILFSGFISILTSDIAAVRICELVSNELSIVRPLFPDGWVQTWLRVVGIAHAGIQLQALSSGDLSLHRLSGGRVHAVLRLPAPTVTHREITDTEWGWDHGFWVWAPGRIALEIRERLKTQAYEALDSLAIRSGLLEEATTYAALAAAEVNRPGFSGGFHQEIPTTMAEIA